MGWRKKTRKAVRAAVSPFKKKVGVIKGLAGKVSGSEGGDGDEARGEAAAQLVKKGVSRQGGGAQINYTTEELV